MSNHINGFDAGPIIYALSYYIKNKKKIYTIAKHNVFGDKNDKNIFTIKNQNKLLQNILKTRYSYLIWFNKFNRNYELVDFLTNYIKAFLQLNNHTVNEIYLYIRNNDIKNFSDFNDCIYLKNKIILLREKIIESLDKYIIKNSPPQYYSDINDFFGIKKKYRFEFGEKTYLYYCT